MKLSEDIRELTALFNRSQTDPNARDEAYDALKTRLGKMARKQLAGERAGHILQGTVLVDDAFQALVCGTSHKWTNRAEFFCAAAKVMRQTLVDHARARKAHKRGGGREIQSLDSVDMPATSIGENPEQLVELDDLLSKLDSKHPDVFKVFHLHYFMGCELKEIAELLGVPYIRTKRRWLMAKTFLRREMLGDEDGKQ